MSKTLCFFTTETTGLQPNYEVTKKNLYKFARMVSLSYKIEQYDNGKLNTIALRSCICKPRCMIISNTQYHGITQEYAEENGLDIESILLTFINDIKKSDILISHNIDFHLKTILAECVRYNIIINLSSYTIIDVMNFNPLYNYVKLNELYKHLIEKGKHSTQETATKLEKIEFCFLQLYAMLKEDITSLQK